MGNKKNQTKMFNFASLMLAGSAAASLPSGFYGGHGSP